MQRGLRKFPNDLTGMTFGRLTVVGRSPVSSSGQEANRAQWHSVCDCGRATISPRYNLTSGKATSCGCFAAEIASANAIARTGYRKLDARTRSAEYGAYRTMLSRCHNSNSTGYHKYGARGVVVCDRWRGSFDAFLEDMGSKPSRAHSLDRFPDQSGNYEPGNCRWATAIEQGRNRRNNRLTEVQAAEIRSRREAGEKLRSIAQAFGVHLSLVSLIARGKAWAPVR